MEWQEAIRTVSVSFDRHADSTTTVVTVNGEVDFAVYPKLRTVLMHEVDAGQNLIVDLTAVDFLDSTGLGLLVGVHTRARERAARLGTTATELILVITAAEVLRTLEITGLDRLFTIVDRI